MKPSSTSILSLLSTVLLISGAQAKDPKGESTAVVQGSRANFKDLISSQEPVLVEFFAPCKPN